MMLSPPITGGSGDHDAFSTYHRRLLSYCRRSPSRSLVEVERCGPGEGTVFLLVVG
jgi:hypothetical protein